MTTDGHNARIRGIWDEFAPVYDRQMAFAERLLFAGAREWACAQAVGETLEVGVGTGLNLPYYPDGAVLTGVDLSPRMLALARGRAAELGRKVTLLEGDAERLGLPDASFDTVVATFTLCSVPDHLAALAEMKRVLRPGGRLVLVDHVASRYAALRVLQRWYEKLTVRKFGDHQTRRPAVDAERLGFVIDRSERRKAGTAEWLTGHKPLSA